MLFAFNIPYLLFLLAYFSLIVTIVGVFKIADSKLKDHEKKELANKIINSRTNKWSSKRILILIHSFFISFFGKSHFKINCFIKSLFVSLILFFLIYEFQILFMPIGESGDNQKDIILVSVFALALNVPVDYLSLLKSRIILNFIIRSNNKFFQFTMALLSLILSLIIFLFIGYIIMYFLNWCHYNFGPNPEDYRCLKIKHWTHNLPFRNYNSFQAQVFRAGFFTTFLTSIWSIIFLIGLFFIKPIKALKIDRIIKINNETFTDLGLVFSFFMLLCLLFIIIISMLL